ncbi:hypothetical protein BGX27_007391 [Mortierella sp. AM989]|nr:hypothetical protein BGX27_007391 [Mortierella sp. AM989]
MIKNIEKLKQWTGEKMGKCYLAHLDEDFNSLQSETEATVETLERLSETSEAYLKAVSKRLEATDKYKGLAIETFGIVMSAQAHVFPEGSSYGEALLHMGEAHQRIGLAQNEMVRISDYSYLINMLDLRIFEEGLYGAPSSRSSIENEINQLAGSYIACLEREHAQVKDYQHLQRKLHSRRLDYDAKLAKVHRARKEKPEWEEEMQAAKAKYGETRECLLEMMMSIIELQDENLHCLKIYYDAQLECARKTVKILEAIPESTFVTHSHDPSISPSTSCPHKISKQSLYESDDEQSVCSDDHSSIHSESATSHRRSRAGSVSDIRRQAITKRPPTDLSRSFSYSNSTGALKRQSMVSPRLPSIISQPSVLPNRTPHQKHVRAIYNFEASQVDELALRKGDLVRVSEEIDEGWWEGELIDSNGVKHEGMFPSNYVEEVPNDTGLGCPRSNTSCSSRYLDGDEAAYYERGSGSPTINSEPESMPELHTVNIPTVKRVSPPPSRHSSVPAVATRSDLIHTLPPNGSVSLASLPSKLVGVRTPPPLPPRRRTADLLRDSLTFNNAPSPPSAASPSSISSTGMGYIPKDYTISLNSSPAVSGNMGPCCECDCKAFTTNVLKRESCNNCFHNHLINAQ